MISNTMGRCRSCTDEDREKRETLHQRPLVRCGHACQSEPDVSNRTPNTAGRTGFKQAVGYLTNVSAFPNKTGMLHWIRQ